MSSNNKVKGLLKGLRYISEIFENEKEPEMSIGMPTDVKHVAHIGVDGPAAAAKSAPSWMNEFKSTASGGEEDPVKCSSSTTDMQERSCSTRNGKEKSDKPKQPKKSSKSSSSKETSESATKHKKKSKESEDTKKNSRRKRTKESADGSSRQSMNLDFDIASESGSLAGAPEDD